MLIEGILYCTVKYISIFFRKILQASRSLINWIPSKSSTPILLFVGIVHSMENLCKLKIYNKVYGLSEHMTH